MTIYVIRRMLDNGYIQTYSEYLLLVTFSLQQRFGESALLLRWTYIVCSVCAVVESTKQQHSHEPKF